MLSFLHAYADTITHLDENSLYNNRSGILIYEPIFQQKLRVHSPKLFKETLADLESIKNAQDLSYEKLLRFG